MRASFSACLFVDISRVSSHMKSQFDIIKRTKLNKGSNGQHTSLRPEYLTSTHRCQCLPKRIACLWASSTISSVSCKVENKFLFSKLRTSFLFNILFITKQLRNHWLNGYWGSHCQQNQFALYLKISLEQSDLNLDVLLLKKKKDQQVVRKKWLKWSSRTTD